MALAGDCGAFGLWICRRGQSRPRYIEVQKDSYVDESLSEIYSDMLYKVDICGAEGYIYVLFEHKSYIDSMIGFQMLSYMMGIWDKYKKKTKGLPIVVPLVIYHGLKAWSLDQEFLGLFDKISLEKNSEIKQYIPNYRYILYDLSTYTDWEIKGEVVLRLLFRLFRDIYIVDKKRFIELVRDIMIEFKNYEDEVHPTKYLHSYLNYIMNVREDISSEEVLKITDIVEYKKGREVVMTWAEKLRIEAMEQGIELGLEQGLEQGIELGKMKVARKLLEEGLDLNLISEVTELSIEEIEGLR